MEDPKCKGSLPQALQNKLTYQKLSDFFYKLSRKKKKHISDEKLFFMTLVAHGGSAALSKAVLAPFDRIKVLLQLQPNLALTPYYFLQFKRLKDGFYGIYKNQGLKAFWWGFGPHTWNIFQSTAVRLTAYQRLRVFFFPEAGREQSYSGFSLYWRKVTCYFASTSVCLLISYPLDVAYTRKCADGGFPWNPVKKTYKSSMQCSVINCVYQGFSSIYRGFPLCIAASFLFICIAQGFHNFFEDFILLNKSTLSLSFPSIMKTYSNNSSFTESPIWNHNQNNSLNLINEAQTNDEQSTIHDDSSGNDFSSNSILLKENMQYPPTEPQIRAFLAAPLELFPWNLISGVLAGLLAQTITYPLDTIRRRYQYDGSCPWTTPPFLRQYSSILDCFQTSFRQGVSKLYKGCGINVLKTIPECIVLSGLYYFIKTTLPS